MHVFIMLLLVIHAVQQLPHNHNKERPLREKRVVLVTSVLFACPYFNCRLICPSRTQLEKKTTFFIQCHVDSNQGMSSVRIRHVCTRGRGHVYRLSTVAQKEPAYQISVQFLG